MLAEANGPPPHIGQGIVGAGLSVTELPPQETVGSSAVEPTPQEAAPPTASLPAAAAVAIH
jgi:hypothetical protein